MHPTPNDSAPMAPRPSAPAVMRSRQRLLSIVLAVPLVLLASCSSDTGSPPATTAGVSTTAAPSGIITMYEVADVVAIGDNTPVRFSPAPPARLEQIPGPGDVIILESTLFGRAKTRTANTDTEPPPAVPGASLPSGDYQTFDPEGDKIGTLQGTCTFIRVEDKRPTSDDRTMACNVTLVLADGTLTYGGLLDVDDLEAARPATVPVIGGTGTYAGAHGTLAITQPSVQAFDRFRLDLHLQP